MFSKFKWQGFSLNQSRYLYYLSQSSTTCLLLHLQSISQFTRQELLVISLGLSVFSYSSLSQAPEFNTSQNYADSLNKMSWVFQSLFLLPCYTSYHFSCHFLSVFQFILYHACRVFFLNDIPCHLPAPNTLSSPPSKSTDSQHGSGYTGILSCSHLIASSSSTFPGTPHAPLFHLALSELALKQQCLKHIYAKSVILWLGVFLLSGNIVPCLFQMCLFLTNPLILFVMIVHISWSSSRYFLIFWSPNPSCRSLTNGKDVDLPSWDTDIILAL